MPKRIKYLYLIVSVAAAVSCTTAINDGRISPSLHTDAVKQHAIDPSKLRTFQNAMRPIQGELKAKYDLARYFQLISRHRIAIETLKELIVLDPTHADAHNAIGLSYDFLGDYKSARIHYYTAIAMNPEMSHAFNNLGYSCILSGDYVSAIKALRHAVALDGTNDRYRRNLGFAYFKNGNMAMASMEFKKVEDTGAIEEKLLPNKNINSRQEIDAEKRLPESSPAGSPNADNGIDLSPMAESISIDDTAGIDDVVFQEPCETGMTECLAATNGAGGQVIAEDDIAVPSEAKKNIAIEISNGNGVHRMAAKVGKYLETHGVLVSEVNNADHFAYPGTTIYYEEGLKVEAARIGNLLHRMSAAARLESFNDGQTPFIRVLIGRDVMTLSALSVDVANGNGVNGMARRLGRRLAREGFKVENMNNADHFGYQETVVFCSKGNVENAKLVAAALPGDRTRRVVELNDSIDRIQVLLGADIIF